MYSSMNSDKGLSGLSEVYGAIYMYFVSRKNVRAVLLIFDKFYGVKSEA